MTELEQALVALGHELEYPVTPNLRRAVRERIERRARTRRWLVLALAVAVVGVGIAMAVPDARSAPQQQSPRGTRPRPPRRPSSRPSAAPSC